MTRWAMGLVAALAVAVMLGGPARAQDYPNKTVKIIVPFPPGGTADAMPRIVADFLTRKWGQPVIVENRAGAGGNVGAAFTRQKFHGREAIVESDWLVPP